MWILIVYTFIRTCFGPVLLRSIQGLADLIHYFLGQLIAGTDNLYQSNNKLSVLTALGDKRYFFIPSRYSLQSLHIHLSRDWLSGLRRIVADYLNQLSYHQLHLLIFIEVYLSRLVATQADTS